jgi:hypothetical protein
MRGAAGDQKPGIMEGFAEFGKIAVRDKTQALKRYQGK